MIHMLLLEDEDRIAQEIVSQLEQAHYTVTHVKTLAQTVLINFEKFSLAVLDWNLPDGEGIEVVVKLRQRGLSLPILMLTANTDPGHRKQATELGVNDFLGKPFYFHELKARIELLLEKTNITSGLRIETSGIEVFKKEMKVLYKKVEVSLAKKEYDLLLFFLAHPNTVFSRNEILDAVWGEDVHSSNRTVDTHILHLRKKFSAELFQTVWSTGYRFVPEVTK